MKHEETIFRAVRDAIVEASTIRDSNGVEQVVLHADPIVDAMLLVIAVALVNSPANRLCATAIAARRDGQTFN
jgi:hypothetical protein